MSKGRIVMTVSDIEPTVDSVNRDTKHGAAYISVRALEVLRNRAALDEVWEALAKAAVSLIEGHPDMAVLANRLNRVMYQSKESRSARAVAEHAQSLIERAIADDEAASEHAAKLVAGRAVLTLSRSGTVFDALCMAEPKPTSVAVAESHPGGEGVGVAKRLTQLGLWVTLVPDAAVVPLVEARQVDLVLIGADSFHPSGAVVNKVGSKAAALAARQAGIPFYVVAATDKLRVEVDHDVVDPIFETVPAEAVAGIVTERGVLQPNDLETLAAELKELSAWRS